MSRLRRDLVIGLGTALAVVATMAVDHLIGTEAQPAEEDVTLEDPVAFLIAVAISLTLLGVLFRYVVGRVGNDDDRAARLGIGCAVGAVLLLPLVFLALPLPPAGAALALGLRGRDGKRRALATVSAAIGGLVMLLVAVAYVGAVAT